MPDAEGSRALVLGVIVAPGLAHELTAEIVAELQGDLSERYPSVEWETELTVDPLVVPPANANEIADAARQKLLDARWDMAIVVTDLPLRVGRRPVTRHVSRTHRVAVVSLPALGALQLRRRLRRALVELVGALLGDPGAGGRWERGVLREIARDTSQRTSLLFVPAVVFANLRLLVGMVRANRPWRFASRLYGALAAALAAGAIGIVTFDVWRLSAAASWWRLAAMSLLSLVFTVVAIIVVHGLWERAAASHARGNVVLFNLATAGTITVGIVTLYAVLYVLLLLGAGLVVDPHVLDREVGGETGFLRYAGHAWFIASFATVGGGLGAALESDEAVREAVYAAAARRRD